MSQWKPGDRVRAKFTVLQGIKPITPVGTIVKSEPGSARGWDVEWDYLQKGTRSYPAGYELEREKG